MGSGMSCPDVELSPDKTVIVTGANTGIGYETAKIIAKLGARVIVACRSEEKAKAAIERMQKEHSEEKSKKQTAKRQVDELHLEYMNLDLRSLANTMAFVEAYKAKEYPLHVLICNAGISFGPYELTDDGFEIHFQVNYLSHFLLVLHLLPVLKTSGPNARIVLVSSLMHRFASWNENDIQGSKTTTKGQLYSNSKLYQIMQMFSLSQRLEDTNIAIFSLHPGAVETEINQRGQSEIPTWIKGFESIGRSLHLMRKPYTGALTSITAAVDPKYNDQTALYFDSCKPASLGALPRDKNKQDFLWNYSLDSLKDYIKDDTLDTLTSSRPH